VILKLNIMVRGPPVLNTVAPPDGADCVAERGWIVSDCRKAPHISVVLRRVEELGSRNAALYYRSLIVQFFHQREVPFREGWVAEQARVIVLKSLAPGGTIARAIS